MSNAVEGKAIVTYMIGDNEIKLSPKIVQEFIAGTESNITLQEFKLFAELCKVHKLNPFLKEAYCIKYGSAPATIVVSKDAIVKRAVNNPNYSGKESGIIVCDAQGVVKERQGCFVAPGETLLGGWCKVYRKDWEYPEFVSVSLQEVQQRKKDGSVNSMWESKSATMVEKVAKVRALREAFVDDLGGMFEADEMGINIPDNTYDSHNIIDQYEPGEDEIIDVKNASLDDF